MKYRSLFFLYAITFLFACKTIEPNKNEVRVERKNAAKAEKGKVNKDIADFLVNAADGRMMGMKQGKLAVLKGTTSEIRAYGQLMESDQAKMLKVIKKLAKKRKITLPRIISAEKEDGFKDLTAKSEKAFDKKFIKMMKIDHKRDLKAFKNAREFNDPEIKAFAEEYLPMIQSHLDKLDGLKD